MAIFVDKVKPAVKSVMPRLLLQITRNYLARRWDARYEGRPVAEIFSAIYEEGKWGRGSNGELYSGSGSHNPELVVPYVKAVGKFLRSLPCAPSVVDLGCGDFNIGKQLRPYCSRYVACDIVPEVIRCNEGNFRGMQVDFRCIDIIDDDLPEGDIVFLRQVLQHLSNAQIMKVVPKLYRYKYLVLTEHVPSDREFVANRDKSTGGGTRLSQGSGVVLTEVPFQLRQKSELILCSVEQSLNRRPGTVKTTLYEFLAACSKPAPLQTIQPC